MEKPYMTRNMFTAEQKIKWWGHGEWINEPDEVLFDHHGIQCKVLRIAHPEPNCKDEHVFGGHLCGYVAIPFDHPYYQKMYEEMDIDCHGGLTYGECSDRHWVGFDCAHFFDITPSMEILYEIIPEIKKSTDAINEIYKKLGINQSLFFNKSYRNIDFCIAECESIVDQLLQVK